jgi:hypothetical protein
MKSNLSLSLSLIAAVASITQGAGAQNEPQVPIPRTASEVPGPALGPMTPAFRMQYGTKPGFYMIVGPNAKYLAVAKC